MEPVQTLKNNSSLLQILGVLLLVLGTINPFLNSNNFSTVCIKTTNLAPSWASYIIAFLFGNWKEYIFWVSFAMWQTIAKVVFLKQKNIYPKREKIRALLGSLKILHQRLGREIPEATDALHQSIKSWKIFGWHFRKGRDTASSTSCWVQKGKMAKCSLMKE